MQPVARILLVEPDDVARGLLEATASSLAQVESHRHFQAAQPRLRLAPFDFLVTNVRLDAYNGLHLVYLSSLDRGAPRAIVYTEERDAALAREIQRAGAFYEIRGCLPVTLAGYITRTLPVRDRRDPIRPNRRSVFRGGRRCWDRYLAGQQCA